MSWVDHIEWPIRRIEFERYHHMPDGPVVVGRVQRVERHGEIYFAIHDGGFHEHPALEQYLEREMCVVINWQNRRLELFTWDWEQLATDSFVQILPEDLDN